MPGRLPAEAENGRKRPSVATTAVPNGTKKAFNQKQWNRLHRSATRHECRADYRLKPKTGVNARPSRPQKNKGCRGRSQARESAAAAAGEIDSTRQPYPGLFINRRVREANAPDDGGLCTESNP